MRYLFMYLSLLLLVGSCRQQNVVWPIEAPVTSLADLPATYQPVQVGSAIAGRLKREFQGGKTRTEWRYNERGQLIEYRTYRSEAVESAIQYRYDLSGRLRYIQHFSNNCSYSSSSNCTGPVVWTSYEECSTDADGRIVESRTYLMQNNNRDFRSRTAYAYNTQKQLATVLRFNEKDVLTQRQTFTYDTRGNVIALREQSSIAPADLTDRTFTYTYDTGRNPYLHTLHYPAALFLSANAQLTPGLTYEYRADGLPVRMHQNGAAFDLEYY